MSGGGKGKEESSIKQQTDNSKGKSGGGERVEESSIKLQTDNSKGKSGEGERGGGIIHKATDW